MFAIFSSAFLAASNNFIKPTTSKSVGEIAAFTFRPIFLNDWAISIEGLRVFISKVIASRIAPFRFSFCAKSPKPAFLSKPSIPFKEFAKTPPD
jgi:hypothetical protein